MNKFEKKEIVCFIEIHCHVYTMLYKLHLLQKVKIVAQLINYKLSHKNIWISNWKVINLEKKTLINMIANYMGCCIENTAATRE